MKCVSRPKSPFIVVVVGESGHGHTHVDVLFTFQWMCQYGGECKWGCIEDGGGGQDCGNTAASQDPVV